MNVTLEDLKGPEDIGGVVRSVVFAWRACREGKLRPPVLCRLPKAVWRQQERLLLITKNKRILDSLADTKIWRKNSLSWICWNIPLYTRLSHNVHSSLRWMRSLKNIEERGLARSKLSESIFKNRRGSEKYQLWSPAYNKTNPSRGHELRNRTRIRHHDVRIVVTVDVNGWDRAVL
jgi:hypothetical protein